ncbi:MAG: HepT-like ribonuclease domain-containing protein [bacterium]
MKTNKAYLYILRDSIDKIIIYTSNNSFEEFKNSELVQDAVIRRFDVISQACFKLSDELKYKIDFIPWERIIDIKKKLITDDFEINVSKVWEIVKEDLPILRDDIDKVVVELNQTS